MNLLIINASPRRNGNISKRLELMKEEAVRLGADVNVEYAQSWNIRPCIGCMKCRSAKNCVLPEDDSQRVLSLIRDCDALIIGSPTYWGNMPATLKLLFDRTVYGLMDENRLAMPVPLHKGKKAIIVCTSSSMAIQCPYGPDRRCCKGNKGGNRDGRFQSPFNSKRRNKESS